MAGSTGMAQRISVVWAPQPGPQHAFVKCPCDEIFFGGSRGGGKSDAAIGRFAIRAGLYGKDYVGVFFRRTLVDLKEAIERSKQIYGPLGARYLGTDKVWLFPNGARVKFAYLDSDSDADNYQGHNYQDVAFEEIQQWPDPSPINKLRATLRSGAGVPCQLTATGNPGGVGHSWVKARYIDPAPLGWMVIPETFTDPFTGAKVTKRRVFIPSRLRDNKYLGADYVANLYQSGSESLVRAWLAGDWDAIEGAYFEEFSAQRHVLRPAELPAHWLRVRAMDWGSAAPFVVLWGAVASEDWRHPGGTWVPRGAIVVYREDYGASAPNVGLKLTAEQVAARILAAEGRGEVAFGVIDPAAFAEDGGPSIAERMFHAGVTFRRADNSRLPGWDQVRSRLVGDGDGRPMLFIWETCTNLIRTFPVAQHDRHRPEDMDSAGDDHALDALRYLAMSRPWIASKPKPQAAAIDTGMPTLGQLTRDFDRRIRAGRRFA